MQLCLAEDMLSLANASGQYRAKEGVEGYDSTEYPRLRIKSLDSGEDPLFRRVELSFTCYWISHKNAIRFHGCGIGSLGKDGVVQFSFVDEVGRHGTGTFRRKGGQFELSLTCSEHITDDLHDSDKMTFVYNKTILFGKGG